MVNDDKFSLYDTKADIHDLGVGASLSSLTDRAHANKRMLLGNTNSVGRPQPSGRIHNSASWKGQCEASADSHQNTHSKRVYNDSRAKHLITTSVDGDVTMKKVCDKHMEEALFTARSAGHNLLTSPDQRVTSGDSRPITIVARLTRANNDAHRAHHGLEPETIGNIDGSGNRRKIVKQKSDPNTSFVKIEGTWKPARLLPEDTTDAPKKRGRPVGSGDSKPRKRRIPISEIRGDQDQPKRGRGRPVGSTTNPDAPKRKKKLTEPQEIRMVNGREMKVTHLPEDKRATQRNERLTRRTGSAFRAKEGKGQVK